MVGDAWDRISLFLYFLSLLYLPPLASAISPCRSETK
jgi:hypothetical protein